MGKGRRDTISTSTQISTKPLKQQEMNEYTINKKITSVSNFDSTRSPDRYNTHKSLEWDLQVEIGNQQIYNFYLP